MSKEEFRQLADTWYQDTGMYSSWWQIRDHPSYKTIVSYGIDALPLVLMELRENRGNWYEYLCELMIINPVPQEEWGFVRKMNQRWLDYFMSS